MPTLGEVQTAMLLAATNPNSPHFLRTMNEMSVLDFEKKDERLNIDRVILALLNEKDLEKDLITREQLEKAQKENEKYLAEYAAYQKEIYKEGQDNLNLEPKQLQEHHETEESKLQQALRDINKRLENLSREHAEIKRKSDLVQDQTRNNLKGALENKSITLDNGQTKMLDAERMSNAVVSHSYDPNRIVAQVPGMASANPVVQQQNAKKMSDVNVVMSELRAIAEISNVASENTDNRMLKPSEIRKRLANQNNKAVVDAVVDKVIQQYPEAQKVNLEAIQASEQCLKEQKKMIEDKLAENTKKLVQKEGVSQEYKTPTLKVGNKT